MTVILALSLIGSLSLISACVAGITLWLQLKPSPVANVHELETQVTQLRLQLNDLVDRFTTWERRERTRRLREGKEQAEEPAPSTDPADIRRALRKRMVSAHFNRGS